MKIGYGFLSLALPAVIYKVVHRLTGTPIDFLSREVGVLGAMALVGFVVGNSILGLAIIRAALRE